MLIFFIHATSSLHEPPAAIHVYAYTIRVPQYMHAMCMFIEVPCNVALYVYIANMLIFFIHATSSLHEPPAAIHVYAYTIRVPQYMHAMCMFIEVPCNVALYVYIASYIYIVTSSIIHNFAWLQKGIANVFGILSYHVFAIYREPNMSTWCYGKVFLWILLHGNPLKT